VPCQRRAQFPSLGFRSSLVCHRKGRLISTCNAAIYSRDAIQRLLAVRTNFYHYYSRRITPRMALERGILRNGNRTKTAGIVVLRQYDSENWSSSRHAENRLIRYVQHKDTWGKSSSDRLSPSSDRSGPQFMNSFRSNQKVKSESCQPRRRARVRNHGVSGGH
jgi:hypothetical protein